jgi:hypothetical protein
MGCEWTTPVPGATVQYSVQHSSVRYLSSDRRLNSCAAVPAVVCTLWAKASDSVPPHREGPCRRFTCLSLSTLSRLLVLTLNPFQFGTPSRRVWKGEEDSGRLSRKSDADMALHLGVLP